MAKQGVLRNGVGRTGTARQGRGKQSKAGPGKKSVGKSRRGMGMESDGRQGRAAEQCKTRDGISRQGSCKVGKEMRVTGGAGKATQGQEKRHRDVKVGDG